MRLLRAIPLGLGALVLAACSALLAANLAAQAVGHRPLKLVPSLLGVTQPGGAAPGWAGLLHGATQQAVAHAAGPQMPLFPWAVRLRNQVEFSLLRSTPVASLLVGRQGELLERAYAADWCTRDVAAWRPGAVAWAAELRAMQDTVEHAGKTFLYVLTPSKVAQYPGFLPAGYACPSAPADRSGLLPAWRAILAEAGIHVADTTAALSAAHAAYPFPLYPPGGTHWNAVGAAIGQQTVLAALNRLLPGSGFAPFRFTWRMVPHATGIDIDLARLMNLFHPAFDGPVPEVAVQAAPAPAGCRPPRVVIVGSSFSETTVAALGALPCSVPAVEYEYWQISTLRWQGGGVAITHAVDPAARDAEVLGAGVLIVEENEERLRQPNHGRALWTFLQGHLAP